MTISGNKQEFLKRAAGGQTSPRTVIVGAMMTFAPIAASVYRYSPIGLSEVERLQLACIIGLVSVVSWTIIGFTRRGE